MVIQRTEIKASNKEISMTLGVSMTTVHQGVRRGERYDLVYAVFKRPDLTDRQKKSYLFSVGLSDLAKTKIWNKYKGVV